MKSIWAEFLVPDDSRPDQVCEILELICRAPEGTAIIFETPRAAVETLRNPQCREDCLEAQRGTIAESIHISYDYPSPVSSEGPWNRSKHIWRRKVSLQALDPATSEIEVELWITFEPGSTLVLISEMKGTPSSSLQFRHDPHVRSSKSLLASRRKNFEVALHSALTFEALAFQPTEISLEGEMIQYRQPLIGSPQYTDFIATFPPASAEICETRLIDGKPFERSEGRKIPLSRTLSERIHLNG